MFSFDESESVSRLAERAQGGDRQALGVLFQRFYGHLYGVARRIVRDDAVAEEVIQDVFVQVLERLEDLRDARCFAGWVRTIARRTALNRAMRRRPETLAEPEAVEAACEGVSSPVADAIRSEDRESVRAGLERLGSLDRQTLEAHYMDGRSVQQMSGDFEAPVGTIKRRLHVARIRLAREVEPLIAV